MILVNLLHRVATNLQFVRGGKKAIPQKEKHTVISNWLAIGHKGKQNRVTEQFLKLRERKKDNLE